MKVFFLIAFLFPIFSFAAPVIEVGYRQTYVYKAPGLVAVIPFDETRAIDFQVKKDEIIFYGNRQSETLYLITTKTGTENVVIKVDKTGTIRKRRLNSREKVYQGMLRFNSVNKISERGRFEFYSLMGNITYNTSKDSYFFGSFNTTSTDIDVYYFKYSHKKFFVGHGYKIVESKAFPVYFWDENLKLTEAGYEGNKFNFTGWIGKQNDFFKGASNRGFESDVFGVHSHLVFGERNHRLDFDYFANPDFDFEAPYLNLKYNLNDETSLSMGGGNPEKPLFRFHGNYGRKDRSKWGLSTVLVEYSYAPEGQEQLFYEFNDIQEQLQITTDFSSKHKGQDGGIYVGPSFERFLRGNFLRNRYGTDLGWKSKKLHVGVRSFLMETDFDTAPTSTVFLNPFVSFLLSEDFYKRTRLTLYQRHMDVSSPMGENFENDFSYSALKLEQSDSRYAYYGELGRANQGTAGDSRENILTGFGGSYKFDSGVTVGTRNQFIFASGDRSGLSNMLASGFVGWRPSRDHLLNLSVNYRLFKGQEVDQAARESTLVRFSYTYRFGGSNNPVQQFFTAKSVSGVVFADLNANGVLDEGESTIEGAKVLVSGQGNEDEDISDSGGYYKTRGFKEGDAVVSVRMPNKFKNYIVAQSQALKISDSLTYNIPVIKTQKVMVRVVDHKTREQLGQELNVKCNDSPYTYPAITRANLPATMYLPVGKTCEIYPVLSETSSGGVQLLNSINDDAKNYPEELILEIKKENSVVIQAYLDKNSNSVYDFGEELSGLVVKIGKNTSKTDLSGEVFAPLEFGLQKIKVLSTEYKCEAKRKEISVMQGEYQNFSTQIKCKKH